MKTKLKIQLAREFRKKATLSESMMWSALRRDKFSDLHFRRQHVIDGYIVDFYCPKLKLAVEIDGGIHKRFLEEDRERQEIIGQRKIKFFRVKGEEVENNIDLVLKQLKDFIAPL